MEEQIAKLQKQIEDLKNQIKDTEIQTPYSSRAQEVHSLESLNQEEKEEYAWEGPARTFNKWEKRKVITAFLWLAIVAIVLIFLSEYILLITVILVALVSIALVVVPPNYTKHIITNKGIMTYGKLYIWEDMTTFWISKKSDNIVMYINTKLTYPSRLFFVIPQKESQHVIQTMLKHLRYYEKRERQGFIGKLSDGEYIKLNDLKSL